MVAINMPQSIRALYRVVFVDFLFYSFSLHTLTKTINSVYRIGDALPWDSKIVSRPKMSSDITPSSTWVILLVVTYDFVEFLVRDITEASIDSIVFDNGT